MERPKRNIFLEYLATRESVVAHLGSFVVLPWSEAFRERVCPGYAPRLREKVGALLFTGAVLSPIFLAPFNPELAAVLAYAEAVVVLSAAIRLRRKPI